MRKGLLTELIGVFEDAKENARVSVTSNVEEVRIDQLREEVIGLLREGDRLRRRAEGAPSSDRKPAGPSVADMEREGMLMGGPQRPQDAPASRRRPGASPKAKDAS